MNLFILAITASFVLQQGVLVVFSFTPSTSTRTRQSQTISATRAPSQLYESQKTLDIVLFGAGDLRTTDHGGLEAALSNANGKVLPLCILDTEDTLPNMPMGRSHTLDTASMLSSALESLNGKLSSIHQDLNLHVKTGTRFKDGLNDVLSDIKLQHPDVEHVTIHACDLGDIDNKLGYGPLSHLEDFQNDEFFTVNKWNCHLRDQAWKDVELDAASFPSTFVDYETKYGLKNVEKDTAIEMNLPRILSAEAVRMDSISKIPSVQAISNLLCSAFDYNLNDKDTMNTLERDRNSGLYATHWGGLSQDTFTEDRVLEATDIFLGQDHDGDEALVEKLKWWSGKDSKLTRNVLSLEHHSMNWMMTGGSESPFKSPSDSIKTTSLIEGELLTRYLAAPLLFGLVSPRYILHKANEAAASKQTTFLDKITPPLFKSRDSINAARTIVEGQEWHKLFAYNNRLQHDGKDDNLNVGYWRWHGFLCRYVGCSISKGSGNGSPKEGIALIHGFGASGSQWKKVIAELKDTFDGDSEFEALAPDLVGFGQGEKPSLTYTQYLWESYTSSFMKDIAIGKQKWSAYTIGGNSIGGYTAMSASADDTVANNNVDPLIVTCNGANGSNKCKGLVLMNSAGKVFKKEEIDSMTTHNGSTVAEATAMDLIGLSR